jgi:hypothetical protein
MNTSFVVANNFLDRKGKESLQKFLDLCNDRTKLNALAEFLGVSPQRASVLRDQLFERVFVYRESTLDALKFNRGMAEQDIEDVDEMVEINKALTQRTKRGVVLALSNERKRRAQ